MSWLFPIRGDKPEQTQGRQISLADVQKQAKEGGSLLVINGTVYDATDLLRGFPGDSSIVLTEAGRDTASALASTRNQDGQQARDAIPSAKQMVILQDFDFWARKVLDDVAWSYYRSAADSETSYDVSMEALRRYFFRPRMLHDMSNGSTKTSFLGLESELPIYIAPVAMVKLGDPLGELNLTRAAADHGIVHVVSTNSSCSVEEIFEAKKDGQSLMYQIYIDQNRNATAELLRNVERLGAKAIVFAADEAWVSKRTLQSRIGGPIPRFALGSFIASGGLPDRVMSWDDVSWIRQHTKLPIIVSGILTIEDIELCVKHGAEGVIISNHGGRTLDYAPAPIDILYELRSHRPDLFSKIDVFIDGGVRSGADVVKLLALGAKAVGIGRPFLYANATHGEDGVKRVIEILQEEIVNNMRNLGAATIRDLKPEMVGPSGPWVGANRPLYAPEVV